MSRQPTGATRLPQHRSRQPLPHRLALAAALCLAGPAVFAQTPAPATPVTSAVAPAPPAESIIVLGNKVPKGEQDITSSIEVLTDRRLEQIGAVDLKDVLQRVGNAGFGIVGSGRFEQFTLRGVPASGVTPSATPVATLYLDGAPVPAEIYGSAVSNAWDVAQFELFRGAQSTLLGRNSLIGAIYIRTTDPGYDPNGRVRFGFGSFGTADVAFAGGTPLVADRAAFRVAGQYTRSDGTVTRSDGTHGDPRESKMARAKLLIEPAPGSSLLGTVMHVTDRRGSQLVSADNPSARIQTTNIAGQIDRSYTVGSLRAETELTRAWSLSAVASLSTGEVNDVSDFDGLPSLGNAYVDPIRRENRKLDDQTLELLVRYRQTAGLVGVAGVFLGQSDSAQTPDVRTIQPVPAVPLDALKQIFGAPADLTDVYRGFGFAAVPGNAPRFTTDPRILGSGLELNFAGRFDNRNRTTGVFTQWDWPFATSWTAVLGLRYERERARFGLRQQNTLLDPGDIATRAGTNTALIAGVATAIAPVYARSGCPSIGLSLTTCAGAIVRNGYGPLVSGLLQQVAGSNFLAPVDLSSERSYSVLLPKVGLTYDLSPQQAVSLVVQRAFRAGGLGVNPVRGTVFSFEPEYSTNVEVAWRQRSADGRLTLNANAFRIDWKDQQLEVARSSTVQDTETVNVGRSTLSGLELGLRLGLGGSWSMFSSVAMLSTRVKEDRRTEDELGGTPSLVGSRFPFAPRLSGSVGLTYEREQGFVGTMDVSHQANSEALLPNSVRNGSRTIANLRLGYRVAGFTVNAQVSNLFDKTYLLNASAAGVNVVVGDPRRYGVSVTGRF